MVGHNPDLEDFIQLLTGQEVLMRTSTLAVVSWRGRWINADADSALLLHHATPRG